MCTNTTAVPRDRLHRAVIASLRETLSPEAFEQHLKRTAEDEAARTSRLAEREALLTRIPVLAAESERLADAVAAGSGALDVLLSAIKARQAEREAAERLVAELEGIERDLRADAASVERLRAVWKDWQGALDASPLLARQLLRKALACPIVVFPRGRGHWSFGGYSRFDSLLTGRIAPGQTLVAQWTNREEIDALVRSHPGWADAGPSAWAAAPIAGGSDVVGGDTVLVNESGPPKPPALRAPAKPWRWASVRSAGLLPRSGQASAFRKVRVASAGESADRIAEMTPTPRAPAPRTSPTRAGEIPPIATTGIPTALVTAASRSRPWGAPYCRLDGVS